MQLDALLREDSAIVVEVDRTAIGEGVRDLIPELPVELRYALAFALVLPERPLVHVP